MASSSTLPISESTTLSTTLTSLSSALAAEATAVAPTSAFSSLSQPNFTTSSLASSFSSFTNSSSTISLASNSSSSAGRSSSLSQSTSHISTFASASATTSSVSSVSSTSFSTTLQATAASTSIPASAASHSTNQLSGGAKAGIAIAVILSLAIIACLIGFIVLKRRRRSESGMDFGWRGKRDSVVLGSGRDGTGMETSTGIGFGSGGSDMGEIIQKMTGGDRLERVGRYEDAEKGLPLPRTDADGDRVRSTRESGISAWRDRIGMAR